MWLALLLAAFAARVPVTVNVGLGPSVSTLGSPGGSMPVSWGLSLSAEGWVGKKTLRSKAVRARVPSAWKATVRELDDLHVRPIYVVVVPDTVFIGPVFSGPQTLERPTLGGAALRGAMWTPITVNLAHQVRPFHFSLGLAPRLALVHVEAEGLPPVTTGWAGLTLTPEWESKMKRPVGVAAGASVGPGFGGRLPGGERPWLYASGHVRLQVRVPIEVKL